MRAVFLGTSGAWPTPRPGCACAQCSEARADVRRRRTRSGLYLDLGSEIVLVDAGPDVFHQFEREGLPPRVDRVLLSHTHADHCLGLDDLFHMRPDWSRPLKVHAAAWHRAQIEAIFAHLVRPDEPKLDFEEWSPGTRLSYDGVVLEGFDTGHRPEWPTTALLLHLDTPGGLRRVAYATDMGEMPPASCERLRGIDLLVGDGSFLGAPRHGHVGTDAVLRLARTLGIRRVAFTHIGHLEVADRDLRCRLGPDVAVAYDGGDLLALLDNA